MPCGFELGGAPSRKESNLDDISGWLKHKLYGFLFVPVIRAIPQMEKFWCDRCGKWLKLSQSSGNVNHHVIAMHRTEVSTTQGKDKEQVRLDGRSEMLLLLLENDLPFRFVESPRLRMLTGISIGRRAISNFAGDARAALQKELKGLLSGCKKGEIALTFDEWTDAQSMQYVGIKVHVIREGKYYVYSLSHLPLYGKSADAAQISEDVKKVLSIAEIDRKISYAVTDGASVMANAVANLHMCQMPCFCHLLNLMIGKIVKALKANLQPLFDAVKLISKSTKFLALVEKARYKSIPTYCPCRWYTLWKCLRNSLGLQSEINQFLINKRQEPVDSAIFDLAGDFFDVVDSFKTASEMLESSEFGSLSEVLRARRLVEFACQKVEMTRPLIWKGWQAAEAKHWKGRVTGETKETIMLAYFLNPVIFAKQYLSQEERTETIRNLRAKVAQRAATLSPRVRAENPGRSTSSASQPERRGTDYKTSSQKPQGHILKCRLTKLTDIYIWQPKWGSSLGLSCSAGG
jgi:hypothetical protein